MRANSKLWLILISLVGIILSGCGVQTVKYQCSNGQVVDSLTLCPTEQNSQTDMAQLKEGFSKLKERLNASIVLDTSWILSEYDKNPIAADEHFKSMNSWFDGRLDDIGRFDDGTVYARFNYVGVYGSDKYIGFGFVCYVLDEKELIPFEKGDNLKFIGSIMGQQNNVYAYCSYFEKYRYY